MARPADYDFYFYEGDSERIVIRLKDYQGHYLNVAHYSFLMEIKKNKYQKNNLLEKEGIVEGDDISFIFTLEELEKLELDKTREVRVYDIEMVSGPTTNTILKGNIIIDRGVNG